MGLAEVRELGEDVAAYVAGACGGGGVLGFCERGGWGWWWLRGIGGGGMLVFEGNFVMVHVRRVF